MLAVDLDSADLAADLARAVRRDGCAVVKNALTPRGLALLREECAACPCNTSTRFFTAYQDQGGTPDAYPDPRHPRNHRFESRVGFVGRKTLERTPRRLGVSLYQDPRLLKFLSRVSGHTLHRSADENGSVYSYQAARNVHNPPWHFDEAHWTAILYLQNSESGGAFEFVPWSRPASKSKDDPDGHAIVEQVVLRGDRSRVVRVAAEPGSLLFFPGAHALHRAEPVSGPTRRIGLVFTFAEEAGFANSPTVNSNNEWDPDQDRRATLPVEGMSISRL